MEQKEQEILEKLLADYHTAEKVHEQKSAELDAQKAVVQAAAKEVTAAKEVMTAQTKVLEELLIREIDGRFRELRGYKTLVQEGQFDKAYALLSGKLQAEAAATIPVPKPAVPEPAPAADPDIKAPLELPGPLKGLPAPAPGDKLEVPAPIPLTVPEPGLPMPPRPRRQPEDEIFLGHDAFHLFAVNKEDGQMVWDYEKIYSIFAVQGTKVFVSSMADNSGHITVLEKTTGKKLSEIILPKESPVWDILADEKALYLRLGAEGLLMAVDQEKGKEIWSTAYGCRGIGCSAGKLTRSGKILCGTNRDASEIVAFNPEDGTVLWKKSLRDYLMPIMAGDSRQEGGVYTFSLDESGTVLKLNAQGEMVWKERAVLDCCPCSDHIKELEGTLYLGGARGLAALDGATGKVKWTRKYEEMTNYPHYFERYSTGDLSLNGPTLEVLLLGSAQKYARVVRLDANSGKLQR